MLYPNQNLMGASVLQNQSLESLYLNKGLQLVYIFLGLTPLKLIEIFQLLHPQGRYSKFTSRHLQKVISNCQMYSEGLNPDTLNSQSAKWHTSQYPSNCTSQFSVYSLFWAGKKKSMVSRNITNLQINFCLLGLPQWSVKGFLRRRRGAMVA